MFWAEETACARFPWQEDLKEDHGDQSSGCEGGVMGSEAAGIDWTHTMQSRISSRRNTTTLPVARRVDLGPVIVWQPVSKL